MITACNNTSDQEKHLSADVFAKGSYRYDAGFLKQHTKRVIELSGEAGDAKILLSADYQGRVMTSTATGDSGNSYGWINYELIAARRRKSNSILLAAGNASGWDRKAGNIQFILKRMILTLLKTGRCRQLLILLLMMW
jgi:hypothetical protein